MVPPSAGAVVLVTFPVSDLSNVRLRPAVALAAVGRTGWVPCQITSREYADPAAIEICDADFITGSLAKISYVRPGKLFTANDTIIYANLGTLQGSMANRIVEAVIGLLRPKSGTDPAQSSTV